MLEAISMVGELHFVVKRTGDRTRPAERKPRGLVTHETYWDPYY